MESAMSSSLFEETLRTVYYDLKHPDSYASATALYRSVKSIVPSITLKYVKNWLASQNVYTLHAPIRRHFNRRKTVVPGLYHQMQMDLVDLSSISNKNAGYRYLLTAVDVFSRKAFVVPLKNKRDISVKNAIAHIFTNYPPIKYLQTDLGTEFYNRNVKDYLTKQNITLFSTSSDTKSSIVERFNRTLKQKMFKYFTANNTISYVPVLQDLVTSYNNRKHRSIGMAPNQVTLLNQSEVWRRQYHSYMVGYRKGRFIFKNGDHVRISKIARQFRKGYLPAYTNEVFLITDRMATKPVTYKLSDVNGEKLIGSFYEPELQLVQLPLQYQYATS